MSAGQQLADSLFSFACRSSLSFLRNMKLTICAVALACASSVVAVPAGALYGRRLPEEFNAVLKARDNDGKGDSGSYPFNAGILDQKDPVSNKSIPCAFLAR